MLVLTVPRAMATTASEILNFPATSLPTSATVPTTSTPISALLSPRTESRSPGCRYVSATAILSSVGFSGRCASESRKKQGAVSSAERSEI